MDKVMEKVTEAGFEYLKDQVRWQTGMQEELQRLREIHPKIQAVVAYASSTQPHITDQNSALDEWLWQLRDAIDEADDVFDEFEYMKHEEQLMTRHKEEIEQLTRKKKRNKVLSLMKSIKKRFKKIGIRALKNDPNLKRLEAAVKKLDQVSAGVGDFIHLVEAAKLGQREQQEELYRARETGAMPKNDQIGRAKEKDSVLQWLTTEPSNEQQTTLIAGTTNLYKNISLLSIVGHGGMGKTTLLRHVYEDQITNEFDLKMWVCVSNNFDAKKVIVDLLEYLNKERPRLETLAALQESLKSAVMSKKFLLVLDDIWEEEKDESKWEEVLAPLASGKLGSKILVTTRMDSAASMIAKVIKKEEEIWRLEGLEEAECLELLNCHAFAGHNPDDHRKLRSIAGEIVKKLSGYPLAAKVIGGVLNSSLDESHWIKILKTDFRSAIPTQSDIMPILRLSYIFLPKHLQSCFTFCCIFPQDYQFDKDDLVRMWIALGFVHESSNNRGETIEDIGGKYFDLLVKKSFFDKFDDKRYKMHDLLHELAQSVSARECFRVEGNEELPFEIPATIRHLSIQTNNLEVLKKMGKFKNLRTLYINYDEDNQDFVDILVEILEASISIRLLYIEAMHLKSIPEAIGKLIHLRYFKLFFTHVTSLPRSLSNLYHLQFIIYNSYLSDFSHDFLPRDMNNLSNLHCLILPWDKVPMMYGIGKLKFLQKLDDFYVKNEIGYGIGELEHMNDLRQLKITFLENVKDAEETCSAKLCEKRNLTDLSLEWGDIESRKFIHLDEKVLENLRPQNCLKNLTISAYMGIRLAIWMNKVDLISNLTCIKLIGCLELQTLPAFGQLPFLKSLHLSKMPKVKRLEDKFHGNDKVCVFPSLKVLNIEQLEALEEWFDPAAADDFFFPCLTKLCLKYCSNLHELPYLPPKLEELTICKVGWRTLNCRSISKSIPLERLEVCDCPNITDIILDDEITKLAALRYLTIRDCPNLNSPGGHQEEVETSENCKLILNELTINDPSVLLIEPLRSIASVQELTIEFNKELVSFPNVVEQYWFPKVSSSLCKLKLSFLQSLPSSLESLSSLKILKVEWVPQLQVLPNLPASLEELRLSFLESLQSLPSSLESLSSLKILEMLNVPELQVLPNLPASLEELFLAHLKSLQSLPSSLESLSSLKILRVNDVLQLQVLPNLPASLEELDLVDLESLQSLPSSLESLSSLKILRVKDVPLLQVLPNLPASLEELELSFLQSLQSLPSSLESLSSLKILRVNAVPLLQVLPNLPASLEELELRRLESLQSLPSSLESLSSLKILKVAWVPQLQVLPNLPASLEELRLNPCSLPLPPWRAFLHLRF